MPPKPSAAGGAGATIRGKQAAVAEGSLLQFLRSVGYRDSLPPSTVAWLESAPVFRFLASKLSHDNFVTPEEEQEYSELMLARGPDASLYDAVDNDGLSCCSDLSDRASTQQLQGAAGRGSSSSRQEARDPFLSELSDEEVSRMLEVEEARHAQLEQQVSALRAATGALEASTKQQADTQGSLFFGLKAHAANELSAARLDAQAMCEALDATLHSLGSVAAELASLAQQPQAWLVAAADQSSYRGMDNAVNAQHLRGVQVLDVNDLSLDLHQPAAATALHPASTPAAKAAAAACMQPPAALPVGADGALTPRGASQQQQQQQQGQQQQPLTPRHHQTRGQALAEALTEAANKRRAAHAARNAALNTEMSRQQHAFMVAYTRDVDAALQEQGLRAQIAAAQQVRSSSGEFAALLSKGPAVLQQLSRQCADAGAARRQLQEGSMAPLIAQVAQLNDCHIVVGDYDRHLAKVTYAMDRKRAMLDSLLRRASLHLVLLLCGIEELRQVGAVSGELQQTAHLLEGHIAATEARLQRCAAALDALDKAQSSSNVQAGDSYLCAFMAAADGSLALPQQQQQQGIGGDTAAAAGGTQEPQTPGDAHLRPGGNKSSGIFTPSYAPTSNIIDKLQGLSDSMDGSSQQLQRLLDLLPAQLAQLKASACRLHSTAFPPGQPAHGGAAASSSAASTAGGGGGSVGGSTWGGSQSAAASTRSVQSAGSGGGGGGSSGGDAVAAAAAQHPQLLLTLPEVADATAAVRGCLDQLQAEANCAISQQNQAVQTKGRGKDKELERSVMAKFFKQPQELAAEVDALRASVQQLQLSNALSF